MKCPCGSGNDQKTCCEPIIDGKTPAPTAEALMRARYTAHVTGKIPFLRASLAPEVREGFDADEVGKWATQSEWLGLKILSSSEKARRGTVKFVATYRANGKTLEHHEVATFRKDEADGRWYFLDGEPQVREREEGEEDEVQPVTTIVRDAPKVGRNDPCPCGSGKKYKKCCGK